MVETRAVWAIPGLLILYATLFLMASPHNDHLILYNGYEYSYGTDLNEETTEIEHQAIPEI